MGGGSRSPGGVALIDHLVERYRTPSTIAIALLGSHARGEATPYSDVDLLIFEDTTPVTYHLEYLDGRLISISHTTIDSKRADMQQPQTAIWAVPGLRTCQILFDPQGHLADLCQEANAFEWTPLQAAANAYASEQVMGYAEEAHKILSGLVRGHESTVLYGCWGMVRGMAQVVLVQRGVLIPTENEYIELVQITAGADWARQYRVATGLDVIDGTPAIQRGLAALRLYGLTAALMRPICEPAHWAVVEGALSLITAYLET